MCWPACRTCSVWTGSRWGAALAGGATNQWVLGFAGAGTGGSRPATGPALSMRFDAPQVRPSERIAAAQQLPALEARLRAELEAAGIDPEAAAQVCGS